MKQSTLVVTIALALLTQIPAGAGTDDPFAWLEGDWVRETRRGFVTESWNRVSDDTMEGSDSVSSGDETRVSEYLRLERFGDDVFYVAKPVENPFPTAFKLIEAKGSRFVFENLEHDFPQRIIYEPEGERGLLARIEGMVEGELQSVDFHFERRD